MQVTFVLSTVNSVHENCLCRGGTEECQTEQLDMARRIADHHRIPKLSGRKYRISLIRRRGYYFFTVCFSAATIRGQIYFIGRPANSNIQIGMIDTGSSSETGLKR